MKPFVRQRLLLWCLVLVCVLLAVYVALQVVAYMQPEEAADAAAAISGISTFPLAIGFTRLRINIREKIILSCPANFSDGYSELKTAMAIPRKQAVKAIVRKVSTFITSRNVKSDKHKYRRRDYQHYRKANEYAENRRQYPACIFHENLYLRQTEKLRSNVRRTEY